MAQKKIPNRFPSFRSLTAEQRSRYCNGCGPKGSWVPIPEIFFHASCDQHDFYYTCGGQEIDRLAADLMFHEAMKEDVRGLPWYKRPRGYFLAWAYYRAVRRWGGKASFVYAPRPYTIEELDLLWEFEKNKQGFLSRLRGIGVDR